MKRKFVKFLAVGTILSALFALGACWTEKPEPSSTPEINEEELKDVTLANFEQWGPDFQLLRINSSFGKITRNDDAEFVQSGQYSAKIQPLGGLYTTANPVVWMPLKSEYFSYDYENFEKYEKITLEVYNAQDEEKTLKVGLISEVDGMDVKYMPSTEYTLESGWNNIVYEIDQIYVDVTAKIKEVKGVYIEFERTGSRDLADAPVFYLDDIVLRAGEKLFDLAEHVEFEEGELCDFEKDFQKAAMQTILYLESDRPEIEVVTATDYSIQATSGEKMARVLLKGNPNNNAHFERLTLSGRLLSFTEYATNKDVSARKNTYVCFDVYNNTDTPLSLWLFNQECGKALAGDYSYLAGSFELLIESKKWQTVSVNLADLDLIGATNVGYFSITWRAFAGQDKEIFFDNFRLESGMGLTLGYSGKLAGGEEISVNVENPYNVDYELVVTSPKGDVIELQDGKFIAGNGGIYTAKMRYEAENYSISRSLEIEIPKDFSAYEFVVGNPVKEDTRVKAIKNDLYTVVVPTLTTQPPYSHIINAKWASGGYGFTDVDLGEYEEIVFWAQPLNSSWFELYGPNGKTIEGINRQEWIEIRLERIKDIDDGWTLFINNKVYNLYTTGGSFKLIGENLNELIKTQINGMYYYSPIYGAKLNGTGTGVQVNCTGDLYEEEEISVNIENPNNLPYEYKIIAPDGSEIELVNEKFTATMPGEYKVELAITIDGYTINKKVSIPIETDWSKFTTLDGFILNYATATEVTDDTNTYTEKTYEYTQDAWNYKWAKEWNINNYKEIVFYVKPVSGAWITIEVGTTKVLDSSTATWQQIRITKQVDGTWLVRGPLGSGVYNGGNGNILAHTTRFTINKGTYYFSEVLVREVEVEIEKPDLSAYTTLDGFILNYAESSEVTDLTNVYTAKTYEYTQGSWGYKWAKEWNISKYQEILFYVKPVSGAWITVEVGSTKVLDSSAATWQQIKITNQLDGTWRVEGSLGSGVYNGGNGNILAHTTRFTINKGTYYFSEVLVREITEETPNLSGYIALDGFMLNYSTAMEVSDETNIYSEKTYAYTQDSWGYKWAKEWDMSKYKEIVFYVKPTSGAWLKIETSGNELMHNGDAKWQLVKIVKQTDGTWLISGPNGSSYSYSTDNLLANMLRFTLNAGSYRFTNVMVKTEFTELSADLALGYSTLTEVTDSTNTYTSKTYAYEQGSWGYKWASDDSIESYNEVIFYIKSVNGAFMTLATGGKNIIDTNSTSWQQVKFVKQADGTWLATGAKGSATVQSADRFSAMLKYTLNAGTYYFSNVLVK